MLHPTDRDYRYNRERQQTEKRDNAPHNSSLVGIILIIILIALAIFH